MKFYNRTYKVGFFMYNKNMAEYTDYIPEGEENTNDPKVGFVDYKPLPKLDRSKVYSDKVSKPIDSKTKSVSKKQKPKNVKSK